MRAPVAVSGLGMGWRSYPQAGYHPPSPHPPGVVMWIFTETFPQVKAPVPGVTICFHTQRVNAGIPG